nr:hypothetical protein [uncultured Mediterraneibacter sp.]
MSITPLIDMEDARFVLIISLVESTFYIHYRLHWINQDNKIGRIPYKK